MAAVGSKDTRPEMRVRRALWHAGLRYRLHDRSLPGRPDIVFPARRTVVFVHGCFWHGHPGCPKARLPVTGTEWWAAKIRRNQERDLRVLAELDAVGWQAEVVWQCQLKNPTTLPDLVARIRSIPPRSRRR